MKIGTTTASASAYSPNVPGELSFVILASVNQAETEKARFPTSDQAKFDGRLRRPLETMTWTSCSDVHGRLLLHRRYLRRLSTDMPSCASWVIWAAGALARSGFLG